VVKDAALLVWLDAQSNRKEHPNENLARELMELFTLGEGNYGEGDVQEAARALTGLSVTAGQRVHFAPKNHDDGEKTILGRTARFEVDGLLAHLVDQPATARRLAWRLCTLFLREELCSPEVVESLAQELRAHELDLGHALALVLRSQLFFSEANLGGAVLAPVPWMVDAARALELFEPAPSTLLLAEWSARLGQDLFYPPTVFGWDGGRAWITTGSMLGRARFAQELTGGTLMPAGADPLRALKSSDSPARELARVLLGDENAPVGGADTPARLVARVLSSPAAQLA
jgi:uncharacterized protein (DUF1800 family)